MGRMKAGLVAYFADEQEIRDAAWHPNAGDVVVDVGCAEGSYTLPALLSGARVYAVEPFAERLATLIDCAQQADIDTELLTPVHAALFDGTPYPDELLYDLREAAPITSDMEPPADSVFLTLDELVARYELERLDWMKIDVEGAELGVLRGGLQTLSRFRPSLILEDHTLFYPHLQNGLSADAMADLLEDLGYAVQRVPYSGPTSGPRLMWICRHNQRSQDG